MKNRSAATAYAAALANFAALSDKAAAAQATLDSAVRARQALIDQAGGGGAVSAAHLLAAEEKIRSAEAEHQIASAIRASAAALRDNAQIEALAEAAATIRADLSAVLATAENEARAFDEAVQAARDALATLQSTLARIGGIEHRSNDLTGQIEAAARDNPVLAERHRSTWPRAPRVHGPAGFAELAVQVVRPPRVQGEDAEQRYARGSVEAAVRSIAA